MAVSQGKVVLNGGDYFKDYDDSGDDEDGDDHENQVEYPISSSKY